MSKLKIGLIDHHLNNFHSNTFLRLLRGTLSNENADIIAAWESNPTGDDWCGKNNVKRFDSPDDVVREVDCVMIMAPDNTEFHPEFCQLVLPYKKPVFIDKFLAPNLTDAKSIVQQAKQSGTPIMSSSALAFAVELEQMIDSISHEPVEMYSRGLSKWAGYGVHSIAPVLRVMGPDFNRLIDTGTPESHLVTLDYNGKRKAVIEVRHAANEWDYFHWQFGIKIDNSYIGATVKDYDGFYSNLMRRVIQFFNTGKSIFPIESALVTVAILETAVKSQESNGQWMENSMK